MAAPCFEQWPYGKNLLFETLVTDWFCTCQSESTFHTKKYLLMLKNMKNPISVANLLKKLRLRIFRPLEIWQFSRLQKWSFWQCSKFWFWFCSIFALICKLLKLTCKIKNHSLQTCQNNILGTLRLTKLISRQIQVVGNYQNSTLCTVWLII